MGVVEEVLAIGINLEAIVATADGQLQGAGCEARARPEAWEGGEERPRLTSKNWPGPNGLWETLLSSDPHEPFR